MNANVSIMIDLPADLAEAMRLKVEAGEYASTEAMLEAGVRSLLEDDLALEAWLREDVVAGHAEYLSDPDSAREADEVLPHLRERRARVRG
jgi:Arc/MetJ-type ribon-helix-helix transcriptional regulator